MKLASIGSGVIVEQFLDACLKVEGVEIEAIYSRTYETGKALADKFKVTQVYTDLAEMLKDPNIDTVYIASPNSIHYEQAKQVLLACKNAIVEKPFTSHDIESADLIDTAKKQNVFLFEAMSIHDMPNLVLLKEKMALIEPIKWVEMSMCQYSSKFNALKAGECPNVFNPEFSGGALMDLNIYHLNFCIDCFGYPKSSSYFAQKHENGIDLGGLLYLEYPNLKVSAVATKDSYGRPNGVFHGEKGMIEFTEGINGLRSFTLTLGKISEKFNLQDQDNRLVYEVEFFEKCIQNKDTSAMHKRLDQTQKTMRLLTELRKQAQIVFVKDSI